MQIAYKILFLKFTVFGIHKKKLTASFWKIPLSEYNIIEILLNLLFLLALFYLLQGKSRFQISVSSTHTPTPLYLAMPIDIYSLQLHSAT